MVLKVYVTLLLFFVAAITAPCILASQEDIVEYEYIARGVAKEKRKRSLFPSSFHQPRHLADYGEWVLMGDTIHENIPHQYARFGDSVSLSGDGSILAVVSLGHVHVYKWNMSTSSWDPMGEPIVAKNGKYSIGKQVSIAKDALRVAVGCSYRSTSDQASVYEWKDSSSSWEMMGDEILSGVADEEHFGRIVSMSDDGERVAIGDPDRIPGFVQVYQWDSSGSSWDQIGDTIYGDGGYFSIGLSIAGKGNRFVVGDAFDEAVFVFEDKDSSWIQLGDTLRGDTLTYDDFFGWSVSMSRNGDRFVVSAIIDDEERGFVRVYRWDTNSWKQVGNDVIGDAPDDRAGRAVSMSSDGDIILVGSEQYGSGSGKAQISKFDGTSWIQLGTDIIGETYDDKFDISDSTISLSGDGHTVAIPGEKGVRVFKFVDGSSGSFPNNFSKVTCEYYSCLAFLLDSIGLSSEALGDKNLDSYLQKVRLKTKVASKKIKQVGDVIVSLDRLRQAIAWARRLEARSTNLGNTDAVDFAVEFGYEGSACAASLVGDFINAFNNKGILDVEFLEGQPTKFLKMAEQKMDDKQWKRSVVKSLRAIRSLMKELGERYIPLCND